MTTDCPWEHSPATRTSGHGIGRIRSAEPGAGCASGCRSVGVRGGGQSGAAPAKYAARAAPSRLNRATARNGRRSRAVAAAWFQSDFRENGARFGRMPSSLQPLPRRAVASSSFRGDFQRKRRIAWRAAVEPRPLPRRAPPRPSPSHIGPRGAPGVASAGPRPRPAPAGVGRADTASSCCTSVGVSSPGPIATARMPFRRRLPSGFPTCPICRHGPRPCWS